MKMIKVWKVLHHQNDRGDRFNVRYVATEKLAQEVAQKPWGYCGAPGHAEEAEIVIYDTAEEITGGN
jgi:hypothetical protein